jgi:hypothetical protein
MEDVAVAPLPALLPALERGRRIRFAHRVHALTGWGAVAMGICHQLAILGAARGRSGTWIGNELAIGLSVILPGAAIAWSARQPARRAATGLTATAALVVVSLAQLIGWHAAFPAVFATFGIVDGIGSTFALTRRGWARLLLTLLFGIALLVLALAIFGGALLPVP